MGRTGNRYKNFALAILINGGRFQDALIGSMEPIHCREGSISPVLISEVGAACSTVPDANVPKSTSSSVEIFTFTDSIQQRRINSSAQYHNGGEQSVF